MSQPLLRAFLTLWFRMRVEGAGHLATRGPVVFALHPSGALDPLLVRALLPRGTLPLDTGAAEALAALRAGRSVAAEPRAAAGLAAQTGVPVVAVHSEGLDLCRWSGAPDGTPRRLAPRVRVAVAPPLVLAGTGDAEGAQAVSDAMEDLRCRALDRHASIPAALADTAAAMGADRPALAGHEGAPLSLRRLALAADAFARSLDLPAGERVGLLLPTVPGVLVILVALWRSGLTPALLNPTLGPGPLLSCLATARATRVISSRLLVREAKLQPAVDALVAAGVTILWTEDLQRAVDTPAKVRAALSAWVGSARAGRPAAGRPAAGRDTPAVILFTSGTEGAPKGVVLTHGNLLANVAQLRARTFVAPFDRMLAPLPIFHSLGLTGGLLLPLLAGARVVTYPNPLHYKAIPELARTRAATAIVGTDTFLTGWARRAEPGDFATIRAAIVGAEPVKPTTRVTWTDGFGIPILEGYGATETSPVISMNVPGADRPGTVGRLLPRIDARLEAMEGIEGARLIVRGPNVMAGYIRPENPDALDPPPDGWYDTGDAVTIDEAGFIAIRGRIKRFAKVGGEMISLAAVEALAHRTWPEAHSAAIAVPDPRKGNRVILALAAGPETADTSIVPLQAQARAEGIAEIMLPARVIVLPELPLLASGKPDYPGLMRLIAEAG